MVEVGMENEDKEENRVRDPSSMALALLARPYSICPCNMLASGQMLLPHLDFTCIHMLGHMANYICHSKQPKQFRTVSCYSWVWTNFPNGQATNFVACPNLIGANRETHFGVSPLGDQSKCRAGILAILSASREASRASRQPFLAAARLRCCRQFQPARGQIALVVPNRAAPAEARQQGRQHARQADAGRVSLAGARATQWRVAPHTPCPAGSVPHLMQGRHHHCAALASGVPL